MSNQVAEGSDPVIGEPVAEVIKHAVIGDDEPMEEQAPQASFALVALTYPILLMVLVLCGFLVWGLFFS